MGQWMRMSLKHGQGEGKGQGEVHVKLVWWWVQGQGRGMGKAGWWARGQVGAWTSVWLCGQASYARWEGKGKRGPRKAHTRSKQGPNKVLVVFSMMRLPRGVVETHVSLALYPHIPHHPIIIPLPSSLCRPSWSICYSIHVSAYPEASVCQSDCLGSFVLSLSFVLII